MCLSGIFAILCGLMVLAAVYLEWDWFINFYRVKPVFEELGSKKAKIFYTFLALLMIVIGVWMVISWNWIIDVLASLFFALVIRY